MLYRTEISAILAYFCPNSVAMATALAPLKIQIAYFNSPIPKGCYTREKFLDILYRTEISAILAYFCPNLVAMATALAPLKIQIAYLNSPTPKGCYSGEKFLDMLYRTEISAILAYFCPNLVWRNQGQFCTTYRQIFRLNNSLSGSANSNMLSEFSGEQGRLPWQPNLGKNKPKLRWFQFCTT